jgi:hypothetical protein
MGNLENRLKAVVDAELEKCTEGLYPSLCRLKKSKVGRDNIYHMVKNIISETPMDIRSALAQVESGM